jgi:hypothetical protein
MPSNYGVFGSGVTINGLPILNAYSNKVFWVDSATGSNGNKGTFSKPFATLQKGISSCTASRGDVVVVKSGHTETITAQIDANVAGVSIIGLGPQKPIITVNGAIDGIDVSAAGVSIENLHFAAPGTDDQTSDINIDAAFCTIRNCSSIGSTTAKNKTSFIVITANGNDCLIEGFRGYNAVVDVVSGIAIGAAARVTIRQCDLLSATVGYSTGAIADTATATQVLIDNCTLKNTKAGTAVITFTAGNSTGVTRQCYFSGRHTTIASNVVAGTGMDFFECYTTEEAAKNGLLMPVVDAE